MLKNKNNKRSGLLNVICSVYVIYMITVYLLAVPAGGYRAVSDFKYRLFLSGSIAFVALYIIAAAEIRIVGAAPRKSASQRIGSGSKLGSVFIGSLLAYMFFTVLSGMISEYHGVFLGGERREGILTISLYVLTALFLMRSFRPRRWMSAVFGSAVSLFCILGTVQLTGANPLSLYPTGYNFYDAGVYYSGQFWSTIGNADLCAAFLAMAAAFFAAASIRRKKNSELLLGIPLALTVFSLIELNVEAGYVALIAGFILLPVFLVKDKNTLIHMAETYSIIALSASAGEAVSFGDHFVTWRATKFAGILFIGSLVLFFIGVALRLIIKGKNISGAKIRVCLFAAAGLLAASLFILVLIKGNFNVPFWDQAHEILHGNVSDDFGSGRIFIWKQVWELILKKPLFGGGPDTLSYRGLTGFSRYSTELNMQIIGDIDAAHNEYLNIWVNQGVFALCSYLTAIAVTVIRWWKREKDEPTALCGAAVVFYVIQAFFGISMYITAPYLWMAMGAANKTRERKQ